MSANSNANAFATERHTTTTPPKKFDSRERTQGCRAKRTGELAFVWLVLAGRGRLLVVLFGNCRRLRRRIGVCDDRHYCDWIGIHQRANRLCADGCDWFFFGNYCGRLLAGLAGSAQPV